MSGDQYRAGSEEDGPQLAYLLPRARFMSNYASTLRLGAKVVV